MSVNLDPKVQQSSINDSHFKPKPRASFLDMWVNSIHEGYQMERDPDAYCLKQWNQGERSIPTKTQEGHMKDCKKACDIYKRFAEWHRRGL